MKLIIDQQGAIEEKIFDSKEVVIGRLPESDLVFTSMQVSRLHCRIYVAADFIWVEDLGSSNGTFIDGKRLVPRRPEGLYPSQKIRFGTSEIYIQVVADGLAENPPVQKEDTRTAKIEKEDLKPVINTQALKAPTKADKPLPAYQPPAGSNEPLLTLPQQPSSQSGMTPYISPPLPSYSQALSSNVGGLSEEKSKAKLFEAEQKAMAVLEEAERKAAKIRNDSAREAEEHVAKVRLQAQEAWNRTQEECEALLNETRNQSQYLFEKSRHDANQLLDQAHKEREELRRRHDELLDQDRNSFEQEKKNLIDRLSKEAYLKAQREIELFESESKDRAEKLLIGAELKAKDKLQQLEKKTQDLNEQAEKSAREIISASERKAQEIVRAAEHKADTILSERQNEARQLTQKIDVEKTEHSKSITQWERKKEALALEVKNLEEIKFQLDPDVKKTQDTLKSLTAILEQLRTQKNTEEEELKSIKGHGKELIEQAEDRMKKALAFDDKKRQEHEKLEAERTQFQNEVKTKRERIEKEIIERREREEEAFSKKRIEEEKRLQAWAMAEEEKVRRIEQTHFRNFEHAVLQRLTPAMQKEISQDSVKALLPVLEREIRLSVDNMIKQGPALSEQVTNDERPPLYRNRRFQLSMTMGFLIFAFAIWQVREDHDSNPQAESAISRRIEEKRAIAAAFTIPTTNKFHDNYADNVLSTTGYSKMKQSEKIQGEWIVNLNTFLVDKFRFKEGVAVKVISAESVLVQDLQKLRDEITVDTQKEIEKKMHDREKEYVQELLTIGLKLKHISAIGEREKKFLSGYLEMMTSTEVK